MEIYSARSIARPEQTPKDSLKSGSSTRGKPLDLRIREAANGYVVEENGAYYDSKGMMDLHVAKDADELARLVREMALKAVASQSDQERGI